MARSGTLWTPLNFDLNKAPASCGSLLCSGAWRVGSPYPPLVRAGPSRHIDGLGSAVLGALQELGADQFKQQKNAT